jgi:hypothetical protein
LGQVSQTHSDRHGRLGFRKTAIGSAPSRGRIPQASSRRPASAGENLARSPSRFSISAKTSRRVPVGRNMPLPSLKYHSVISLPSRFICWLLSSSLPIGLTTPVSSHRRAYDSEDCGVSALRIWRR